jgi:hypothetical protein
MRASEFVNESKGKVPKRHNKAQPGAYKFKDAGPDGTDRTYHLNQIMKAAAMADGSRNALKMDDESFAGKHNLAYPYCELEHNMMLQAFNTVSPTQAKQMIKGRDSSELDFVNTTSPIAKRPKDFRKK